MELAPETSHSKINGCSVTSKHPPPPHQGSQASWPSQNSMDRCLCSLLDSTTAWHLYLLMVFRASLSGFRVLNCAASHYTLTLSNTFSSAVHYHLGCTAHVILYHKDIWETVDKKKENTKVISFGYFSKLK